MHYFLNADGNAVVTDLDGKFAAAVEAARRQIDRANNRPQPIGEQQFRMKLQALQLVHLDANVIEDSHTPDTFDQLVFFQSMRRPHHDSDFHAAPACPHETFDNHRILISLILHPQRMPGFIDELRNSLPSVTDTPDEMRMITGPKLLAFPVSIETLNHFVDLMLVPGHDRIVA